MLTAESKGLYNTRKGLWVASKQLISEKGKHTWNKVDLNNKMPSISLNQKVTIKQERKSSKDNIS